MSIVAGRSENGVGKLTNGAPEVEPEPPLLLELPLEGPFSGKPALSRMPSWLSSIPFGNDCALKSRSEVTTAPPDEDEEELVGEYKSPLSMPRKLSDSRMLRYVTPTEGAMLIHFRSKTGVK